MLINIITLRDHCFHVCNNCRESAKGCKVFPLICFPPEDAEIDIQNLYKAVPQLNETFRIIDKIGEGTITIHLT